MKIKRNAQSNVVLTATEWAGSDSFLTATFAGNTMTLTHVGDGYVLDYLGHETEGRFEWIDEAKVAAPQFALDVLAALAEEVAAPTGTPYPYVLIHAHDGGDDVTLLRSGKNLGLFDDDELAALAKELGIDFEPDKNEFLTVHHLGSTAAPRLILRREQAE